jgi:hypothetical protein
MGEPWVPRHLPEKTVGVGKIPGVAAPLRWPSRFDDPTTGGEGFRSSRRDAAGRSCQIRYTRRGEADSRLHETSKWRTYIPVEAVIAPAFRLPHSTGSALELTLARGLQATGFDDAESNAT